MCNFFTYLYINLKYRCYSNINIIMIKYQLTLLKAVNWMLAGLLTMLGFSVASCDETAVEYGTPHAEYEVKGKVTDQSGEPIPGIEVRYGMIYRPMADPEERRDVYETSRTGVDGRYQATFSAFPQRKMRIIATDVDGPENGSYQTDSVDVEIDPLEGGKGSWYEGKATVNIPDIHLKESVEQKE